jgi:hypothetical protein
MIAHIVLFQPKPGLSREQQAAVLAAFEEAARGAPAVRTCRIGRRVTHGLPGYEQLMPQSFEFAAIMEFDTLDGLRAYLQHPAHDAIGRHFSTAAASALAYDYQLFGVDAASQLLG